MIPYLALKGSDFGNFSSYCDESDRIQSPLARAALHPVLVPVSPEKLLLGEGLGGDRARNPRQVQEVTGVDVLCGDVAAPCSARQAQRERQPVARTSRTLVQVLVHHDAGGASTEGKCIDVSVIAGVDTAGVTKALVGGDRVDDVDSLLDVAAISVDGSHD